MKHLNTFLFTMTASTCFFFAGRMVIGSAGADVRPLAKSLGSATINQCRLTGRIESRTNGVYAVFDFDNQTAEEKNIKLNYVAARTPPISPHSRMMSMPQTVKKGALECIVKAGKTTEEILLKETPSAPPVSSKEDAKPDGTATGVTARLEMLTTPEMWSLVVSREEIKGLHGWGAVGPAASDAAISLDKGEALLASTMTEKPEK
ncbi:MAG: hypothetical protein WCN95_04230 [bacterium]